MRRLKVVLGWGVPYACFMAVVVHGRTHGYAIGGFLTLRFAGALMIWLAAGVLGAFCLGSGLRRLHDVRDKRRS
ncbi:MAG TPA: hypothetical protein VFH27_09485 [Longimicrobiaceae bacterium]|nr:hypothetical protein [Longimicrobiaceae bacterium]